LWQARKVRLQFIQVISVTTINREEVSRNWAARGYGCDLWVDPPGQRWEDFTHATDELVVVLEGEMEFVIDGAVSHPAPGEEVYIPAGAVHSVRNIGGSTARWLYGYR
jgi:quercetin dioxygenase-like cupin family protein